MTADQVRANFELGDYNTSISREDFEKYFNKTKEKIRFTFGGWDGKSYHGESRVATIYRTAFSGCEEQKFIKVGKAIHMIDESYTMVEESTGNSNPTTLWLVDVRKSIRKER